MQLYTKIDSYSEQTTDFLKESYNDIIAAIGEDTKREGMVKTPERLQKRFSF